MASRQSPKDLFPGLLNQNPSGLVARSQDHITKKREQVDRIMDVFLQLLPSNYVAQIQGPFYTLQFQSAAEQIAEIQITAQEAFADNAFEYLRPEFMFQVLGLLVFPDATDDGYPTLRGDVTYRDFLRRMVVLLLQGSTKATVEEGLGLLTDATVQVIERSILGRQTAGSAWLFDDQFTFEVNVSETDSAGNQRFPIDPFVLRENVRIVMRALKPAHTLYDYRHLFTETFGQFFNEAMSFDWKNYYYEDFRTFCCGAKSITGSQGETLTDRTLFRDATRDFTSVSVGADVTITSGPNGIHAGGAEGTTASTDARHVGRHRVREVLYFPVGDDSNARAFTTSPTGLSGKATVSGSTITADGVDLGSVVEGETLTFPSGPNAGVYLLKTILGSTGGPIGGSEVLSGNRVRVAPSILRFEQRMQTTAAGQSYEVVVDRLGKQEPRPVSLEDVSQFFLL